MENMKNIYRHIKHITIGSTTYVVDYKKMTSRRCDGSDICKLKYEDGILMKKVRADLYWAILVEPFQESYKEYLADSILLGESRE